MTRDEVITLLAHTVPGLTAAPCGAAEHLWTISPIAGSRASAAVRLSERWISLEAALHEDTALDARRVLRRQSALPGGIKIVRWHEHLGLRAEVPILAETAPARDWLRRELVLAYAGLGTVLRRERCENGACRESDGAEFDPATLVERCTAGGWHGSVAPNGDVRVELASRSAHRLAVLSRYAGVIRAAVTLETGPLAKQGPDTQRALAAFLLRATRSLRWVRAFAAGSDGSVEAVGFECLLAPPNDDQPIAMALDALATACELYGREAEALAESAVLAQHYLAMERDACAQPPVAHHLVDPVPPDSVPNPGAVDFATA
jgi:hypothetical protein